MAAACWRSLICRTQLEAFDEWGALVDFLVTTLLLPRASYWLTERRSIKFPSSRSRFGGGTMGFHEWDRPVDLMSAASSACRCYGRVFRCCLAVVDFLTTWICSPYTKWRGPDHKKLTSFIAGLITSRRHFARWLSYSSQRETEPGGSSRKSCQLHVLTP